MTRLYTHRISRFGFLVLRWVYILLLLASCSFDSETPTASWQIVNGRDEGDPSTRQPIYRIRVPPDWERRDPDVDASIKDSRLPLCEWYKGDIVLTVHNFPYDTLAERVPPQAQVARWKRQLVDSDLALEDVRPYGHGGFAGLRFEAVGTLKGVEGIMVVGYAQQLAREHFQMLHTRPPLRRRQERADYTIKVTGPADQVYPLLSEIDQIARSFELIEEVPAR